MSGTTNFDMEALATMVRAIVRGELTGPEFTSKGVSSGRDTVGVVGDGGGGAVVEVESSLGVEGCGAVDGAKEKCEDGVVDSGGDSDASIGSAVSICGKPVGFSASCGLKFGAIDDVVRTGGKTGGFYRDYVRVPRVKEVRDLLKKEANVVLPSGALVELALATCARACVPDAFERGQDRLRSLQVVGDAALAMALVESCYAAGLSVSSVQALKSEKLSNALMSKVCVASGLGRLLVVPSGINIGMSKVGADALEAVAGVVYLYGGVGAVKKYGAWMRLWK